MARERIHGAAEDTAREVAKPVALALCLISLYAVFHAAFLIPASEWDDRLWKALELLPVAAGICWVSGLLFRESEHSKSGRDEPEHRPAITATLPMQLFGWATALMLVFFAVAWYLETYCIFYRDIRY